MSLTAILLFIWVSAAAGLAAAAEKSEPGKPNPEYCSRRDADPEKCMIQDGPPPTPIVRKKPPPPQKPPPEVRPGKPPPSK